MEKAILFSLENCVKCNQTKDLLGNRKDVEIITFSHDFSQWSQEEIDYAKKYDILEDLQITAPILWHNGEKKVGYLRIRKWLQDTK
jgi:glutaredoxin